MMLQPSTLAKEAASDTSTSVSRNVHSAKIRSRFQHNEACQSFELLGGRLRINLHCTKAIKQMNFSSTRRTGLMSVSPQTVAFQTKIKSPTTTLRNRNVNCRPVKAKYIARSKATTWPDMEKHSDSLNFVLISYDAAWVGAMWVLRRQRW